MNRASVAAVMLHVGFAAAPLRADSQALPVPHEVWSPSGQIVLTVEPHSDGGYSIRNSVASAFRVGLGGIREPLWSLPIYFYEGQGFLADDGDTLVVVRRWPSRRGNFEDIKGVFFYRRGNEFASHRVVDLVANYFAIKCSVSHFRWVRSTGWSKEDSTVVELTTIDGTSHRMSTKSGAITSSYWAAPHHPETCDAGPNSICMNFGPCVAHKLRYNPLANYPEELAAQP